MFDYTQGKDKGTFIQGLLYSHYHGPYRNVLVVLLPFILCVWDNTAGLVMGLVEYIKLLLVGIGWLCL